MKIKRQPGFIAVAFSLLVCFSFSSRPARAEESSMEYRVTESTGEAGFIPKNGEKISPVVKGLTLEPGDRLVTGKEGRVEFATKEGTLMELMDNSNLKVESFSGGVSKFFLKIGKLFGKFAPFQQTAHQYRIHSPVAVASVRGTELEMCVEENGVTQAGVIEGKVAFGPPDESSGQGDVEKSDWQQGEVNVDESKGIVVRPKEKPEQLNDFPPIFVHDLVWFRTIRDRIPKLRDEWKDFTPPAKLQLRQQALRERIKWQVPENMRSGLKSPKEQMKGRFTPPPKAQPAKRVPPRPQSTPNQP